MTQNSQIFRHLMQSPNDLAIMLWNTFMRYKAALEVTLLTVYGLTLQVAHQPALPGSILKQ